ncbi:hypothetical protein U14_05335 [Candidatus Moduliflexus flocculans]|uniref:Uncharacterized protein n=1 Tax=Candidatus Moduliflexus flocculans TaxID=1499966 RepID=A0A081BRM7_9BACT|nr:hypothetical protein U14_05335 [Candidatus Moduliflexus flocculans]
MVWCAWMCLVSPVMAAIDQKWIDDLNQRFPGIGNEFDQAVQQKLAEYGKSVKVEEVVKTLLGSADYIPDQITTARGFTIHSELMLFFPALGQYQDSLREAKLLRDFTLKHSPDDPRVVQTFRGVYAELLILNEQYEQALQEVEETIAINPDEEGNYLSRGVVNVKLGQLDRALEDLQVLIRKPDAAKYAEQLFVFIMQHRDLFKDTDIQKHTMIDKMVRDLEPKSSGRIRIPANLEQSENQAANAPTPMPTATPTPEPVATTALPSPNAAAGTDPLLALINLDADKLSQLLGKPLSETKEDDTIDREYNYQGNTLTISFDKKKKKIVSFQMFFVPPVSEATALANIGVIPRQIEPTLMSDILKVWSPYDTFSKVRLSLSDGNVIAIVVEP